MADALAQAVEKLRRVREEHLPILSQVAGDPGMSPETRRTLLEHLAEEETVLVEHIAALAGAGPVGAAPGLEPHPGLTVGSMRPETPAHVPARGTVGSLRRD